MDCADLSYRGPNIGSRASSSLARSLLSSDGVEAASGVTPFFHKPEFELDNGCGKARLEFSAKQGLRGITASKGNICYAGGHTTAGLHNTVNHSARLMVLHGFVEASFAGNPQGPDSFLSRAMGREEDEVIEHCKTQGLQVMLHASWTSGCKRDELTLVYIGDFGSRL